MLARPRRVSPEQYRVNGSDCTDRSDILTFQGVQAEHGALSAEGRKEVGGPWLPIVVIRVDAVDVELATTTSSDSSASLCSLVLVVGSLQSLFLGELVHSVAHLGAHTATAATLGWTEAEGQLGRSLSRSHQSGIWKGHLRRSKDTRRSVVTPISQQAITRTMALSPWRLVLALALLVAQAKALYFYLNVRLSCTAVFVWVQD